MIVMRTEKRVDTGKKQGFMVTEKKLVHGTNKDPKLLARAGVASTLENVDNVEKMVDDLEQYKEKISQMRETLKKDRGEGKNLKIKLEDSLRELEKFRETCHILQSDKYALVLLVNILKGEKRDLEKRIAEVEQKENAADKRVNELEVQKKLLNEQL